MNNQSYDLIVIGGGAGGSACTASVNAAGYRVAQIERDRLGGTCLNYGCDPTKAMLHIGQMMRRATMAQQYGVRLNDVETDWNSIQTRVRQVQNEMRGGPPEEARAKMREDGIDLIMGEASFVSSHEVEVDGRRLYGENILIATGTEPLVPDIDGLQEAGYITNREAVYLPQLPRRMAVIGGGPVGTEFAQLFHRFGVEICLFDDNEHILVKDDAELAEELAQILIEEGISVHTNSRLQAVELVEEGKELTFSVDGDEQQLVFDEFLIALGRKPALDALNLDTADVKVDDGQIVVDEMLRTSVPHIWAAGDVVTDHPFTHTANAHSAHLAENIFAENPAPFNNKAIPWVTYTSPELAHVGQTEREVKDSGIDYRVGRVRFEDVARAQTTGEKWGQVKLLVGSEGDLLGGHILAINAGELIAPVVLAMRNDLRVDALQNVILPYPTMVEALRQAARSIK